MYKRINKIEKVKWQNINSEYLSASLFFILLYIYNTSESRSRMVCEDFVKIFGGDVTTAKTTTYGNEKFSTFSVIPTLNGPELSTINPFGTAKITF